MTEKENEAIELLKQPPEMPFIYCERENAIRIVLKLIKKQQKEIEIIRCLLYKIRSIAKEILIYTHGDNGEFGPIKNCTKQEVYSSFVEIRNIVNGQYCFLDNEEAINKKIEECIKRGNNENS